MSWSNFTMVQATNYSGILTKKIDDEQRQKLTTSLKGPLRSGRKKIPRPKSCFHCDQKFHSNFCRKLSLRNIRKRTFLSSKFECLTCRKRFKGIANLLLHRTLHNGEHPQTDENPDVLETSLNKEPDSEFPEALGFNSIDSNPELTINEFDLEVQAKQGDIQQNLDLSDVSQSKNKAIQPTGARKRKGKLRMQYISPDSAPGQHPNEDDNTFAQDLVHDFAQVSEENENPKVFIISGDSDLSLTVNGRLNESGESIEHGSGYGEEALYSRREGILSRDTLRPYADSRSCFCSNCQTETHDPRLHQCHHHDLEPYHNHGRKTVTCNCDGCVDNQCKNIAGNCHHHGCNNHNHEEHYAHSHNHRGHCHGNCCTRYDWNDAFMEDEGYRFRPKNPALFNKLCNSSHSAEDRDHYRKHAYEEYTNYMRNSSFSHPEPLPLSYGQRRSASRRPNSRDEATGHRSTRSVRGLSSSHRHRENSESDLAPLDAHSITDNVVGFGQIGSRHGLSNGDHMPKKDIFTAPGSAIRRMKELVSKYSDRHSKRPGLEPIKGLPTEYVDNEDMGMVSANKAESALDSKQEAYVCHICGKDFAWAVTLKRHMLVHTGARQFRCTVCDKAFTRSHHLKRHMTVHTGEKPYVCHICNKAYSRSDRLRSHMSNHEGYVPDVKRGKAPPKQPNVELSSASSTQHTVIASVIPREPEQVSFKIASYESIGKSPDEANDEPKIDDAESPKTDQATQIETDVSDKNNEEPKHDSKPMSFMPGIEKPNTEDTSFSVPDHVHSSLPGYTGLNFQKPERELIPSSRFQMRPSDLGPAGIYAPSSYPLGHSAAFIPGHMIDGGSLERHTEFGTFSTHGTPKRGEYKKPARSPVVSETLGRGSLGFHLDPKQSSLIDGREELMNKQRLGSVSMYFNELHHNANLRRNSLGMEHTMHYGNRDERPALFSSDFPNPFAKFHREDLSNEKSSHLDSMNEKPKDVVHDDQSSSKANNSDLPASNSIGSSAAEPRPEPQDFHMNLFTYRHMVGPGRRSEDSSAKKVLPRTFVCKTCNKGFTRSHHLRRHELIHSGHKPFKCTICGRAFNRSDHLNLHLATHYQSSNGHGQIAKERVKGKKKSADHVDGPDAEGESFAAVVHSEAEPSGDVIAGLKSEETEDHQDFQSNYQSLPASYDDTDDFQHVDFNQETQLKTELTDNDF